MKKTTIVYAHVVLLACTVFFFPNHLLAEEKIIFQEDFEGPNPLGKWDKIGSEIKIVKDTTGNHSLMIQRDNRWDFTRIRRDLHNVKGQIRVEATIKGSNIVPGEKSYYKGILQLMVLDGSREIAHKNNKFIGTFNFVQKEVVVDDLDGNHGVALRIGLQNAKGTMWVDNIKVYNMP